MITRIEELLRNNRAFVERQLQLDSDYFDKLAEGQHPEFLWVGCSDSRVPPDRITGTSPGDMFVHRNIANLVVQTDMNLLSVLQYAVDVLEVQHVIVCGHYGCGGVKTALKQNELGLLNNWLHDVGELSLRHKAELDALADRQHRIDALCELNVIEQVRNVCRSPIVLQAWRRGQDVSVHGWIYNLENGLLRDLDITVHEHSKVGPRLDAALTGQRQLPRHRNRAAQMAPRDISGR